MEDNQRIIESLAKDVMRLSRNTLLVNLRFLDSALSRFELKSGEGFPLSTDGHFLTYDPKYILRCYRTEKEMPVRDYLHMVMHCIFRHMFVDPAIDRPLWDLACDIAVEASISELNLPSAMTKRQTAQQIQLDKLKKSIGNLTAEKIYRELHDNPVSLIRYTDLLDLFKADDHLLWYMGNDEKRSRYGIGSLSGKDSGDGETGEEKNGEPLTAVELAKDWENISRRIQTDMETFSKMQGDKAGGMIQNLAEVNREKYDYTAFLKKFAVMCEVMKINDDEFDYVYYTYGLERYGNMPLIEPLEYKDAKRVREFVIAIDTSGSVAGETVQKFIQKTYNILQSTESFLSKINLHIIQCDAEIQEDRKITSREEFNEYLKTMEIKGLGGTDFRPVFSYVDTLIRQHEFQNLKGLIYFTDGFGTFPAQKPAYESAFVFLQEEINNLDVPPWAIKLILREDEI